MTIHTSLKYTHECLKAKLVKAIFPFQDKTEQFIPSSEMGNSVEGTLSLSYVSIFKEFSLCSEHKHLKIWVV